MNSHGVRLGAVAVRRLGGVLDLVLPPRCLACGGMVERHGRLCGPCWRGLTFLVPPHCRVCGYPLPDAASEAPLCGGCTHEPPAYGRARAALRYDEGTRGLVLAFKHADRTDSAPLFGRWLERAGRELLADADLIVPVPLHRWRLLRRGYNQAAVLARALAQESGLPLAPDVLQRRRATPSQQGLSAQARQLNVTPISFRPHPWHRRRLTGRRIVLVDDVLTTGATVGACSRVLLAAGAEQVDVLTLARVVRDAATPI
jgi:ComF family protein